MDDFRASIVKVRRINRAEASSNVEIRDYSSNDLQNGLLHSFANGLRKKVRSTMVISTQKRQD